MTSSNEPEAAGTPMPAVRPASGFSTDDVGYGRKLAVGVFGVALPVMALSVEFAWEMCRDSFLNPLPTPLHAGLIALVAMTNTVLLLGVGRRYPWWGRLLSGVALTTSTVYAIIFLPATPIGFIAILAYGLGLLVLAPSLSLVAGLLARRLLGPINAPSKAWLRYPSWLGVLVAVILFVIPMIRPFITYTYVKRVISSDPSTGASAIAAIRRAGAEQTLFETCLPKYGRQEGSPLTLSFLLRDLPEGTVASAYYRVTGRACRAVATSATSPVGRGWALIPAADDPEGPDGDDVELKLTSSRIDATIDAPAALGYLEWTWVVHNKFVAQREGLAEIALPPGAVVSRATLWINNEPREAAFAERHQAKAAYDKVVSRRRDPLLVMLTPQGTLQLQFFPVPAEGDLKLRIGITTPLRVIDEKLATLALPHIAYRNFAPIDSHRLWVEAKTPFNCRSAAQVDNGVYRLDRPLPARELQQVGAHCEFALNGLPTPRWARDSLQAGRIVTQQLKPRTQSPPSSVSLVVDGSRGQTEALAGVAAALTAFPEKIPLGITLAGDQPETLLRSTLLDRNTATRMAETLRGWRTQGGADNAGVLTQALESATPGACVIWVHGAQPVELGSLERLHQVLERSASRPRVYELTTANGQNRVAEALFESTAVQTLDASLGVEPALRQLFQSWAGAPQYAFERSLLPEGSEPPPADAQTSDHLVRLWASENVERLAVSYEPGQAVKLAATYKLVTSVSGAVVLENAEQYADSKLSPPGPEQVPSVPEPATVVIVVFVMLGLVAFAMLQRSRTHRVSA